MTRTIFLALAISCAAAASQIAAAQENLAPTTGTQEFAMGGSLSNLSTGGVNLTQATLLLTYGRYTSPSLEWRFGTLLIYQNGGGASDGIGGVLVGPKYFIGSDTGKLQPYLFGYVESEFSAFSQGSTQSIFGVQGGIGADFWVHRDTGLYAELGYTQLWGSGQSASEETLVFGVVGRFN